MSGDRVEWISNNGTDKSFIYMEWYTEKKCWNEKRMRDEINKTGKLNKKSLSFKVNRIERYVPTIIQNEIFTSYL